MADVMKMIEQLLDANDNEVVLNSKLIVDKASGKSLAAYISENTALSEAEINALIEAAVSPIETTLNTFLSGDPDDNGTIDRLKELVAEINANKDSIDALVAGSGSLDIATSASAEPTWTGKLRLIVSDYTPPAE